MTTVIARTSAFLSDVRSEMNKVTWPDRAQLRQATIAILIFVLVIAGLIAVLDIILNGLLVKLIPSLFGVG
jgi:preprotein translocase subunit SecE